jgi:hypothetical protein
MSSNRDIENDLYKIAGGYNVPSAGALEAINQEQERYDNMLRTGLSWNGHKITNVDRTNFQTYKGTIKRITDIWNSGDVVGAARFMLSDDHEHCTYPKRALFEMYEQLSHIEPDLAEGVKLDNIFVFPEYQRKQQEKLDRYRGITPEPKLHSENKKPKIN